MAITVRNFDTAQEMADYLNDVVQGSAQPSSIKGLHGLTLLVDGGAGQQTVTFADADGSGLSPTEVVAQIEAEDASLVGKVKFRNYRHGTPPKYYLTFDVATNVVDKDGTANTILGLPTAADATVGAGAVLIADIVTVEVSGSGNKYTLVHE